MTVVMINSFLENNLSEERQLFLRLLRLNGETYGVNNVFYVRKPCILRGTLEDTDPKKEKTAAPSRKNTVTAEPHAERGRINGLFAMTAVALEKWLIPR
jgi:hypothetical protein